MMHFSSMKNAIGNWSFFLTFSLKELSKDENGVLMSPLLCLGFYELLCLKLFYEIRKECTYLQLYLDELFLLLICSGFFIYLFWLILIWSLHYPLAELLCQLFPVPVYLSDRSLSFSSWSVDVFKWTAFPKLAGSWILFVIWLSSCIFSLARWNYLCSKPVFS